MNPLNLIKSTITKVSKFTTHRNKSHRINDTTIMTFTKKWTNRLMWFGVSWITLSYILAFCGKESIAESLSQTVAKVIISTFMTYMCKSFFETYSEEHNKLKREQLTQDVSTEEVESNQNDI